MKLSDIVKNYRMQNGLTQDDIARLAKCSKAYICMIENGKDSKTGKPINPSITFLHNLATAMNMTSEELYKLLDIDISIRVNEEGLSINESPEEYGSKRPDKKIDIYKELQGATVLFNLTCKKSPPSIGGEMNCGFFCGFDALRKTIAL